MKRFNNIYFAGCSFLLLLTACTKNELHSVEAVDQSNQAQAKVMVCTPYRGNPLYQIKVNGTRVSNTLGATTNPTPFPGGGLNTGGGSTSDYIALAPGSNKVDIVIPKAGTTTDSLLLATSTVTLDAAKKYSLFFTDTAANTAAVLVQDSLARPDSGYAKYVFVNLIPDAAALDLYIGTVKVATAVPYKGVSTSFVLPTNNTSTVWGIRTAGGATNLITYTSASSIGNQRIYTVIARGYAGITTASDVRSRKISLIYTR
ncbi:hypothetical protein HNQ91_002675 [Filimonas zeae]|uniref:DUF4397 domain-containing protein n=1 Tax=Filimonas zeae TaxID=1737353 RepID=A0A917MW70_9BACT|nr:DUF4397 domain-containing protein [Filimonas zeae]MDR6339610.1 hypothetical protein [Filimonas zeae]GGH68784.1 hypothetical protein GCM10011379_25410 [Filimonas zeae]